MPPKDQPPSGCVELGSLIRAARPKLDEYGAVWTFKKKWRILYRCNPVIGWNGRKEGEFQKAAWWVYEETQRRARALIEQPELGLPEPESDEDRHATA